MIQVIFSEISLKKVAKAISFFQNAKQFIIIQADNFKKTSVKNVQILDFVHTSDVGLCQRNNNDIKISFLCSLDQSILLNSL